MGSGKEAATRGWSCPRTRRVRPGATPCRTARGDIWLLDFARGVRTRFTFRQTPGSFPVWSPDGNRIIFAAGNRLDTLYEKAASGAGEEKELLKKPGEIKAPTSWSRDGRFLLYYTVNVPKTGSDLWVLPLEGDRKPVLLLGTEFIEGLGSFSPDMRWIAYASNESVGLRFTFGRSLLRDLPDLARRGQMAGIQGRRYPSPKWRGDGKEIIFAGPNGAVMAVDVNGTGAAFQMGTPQQLFTAPPNAGGDVTADGKRFLFPVAPAQGQQTTQTPITVVLNWQADLKK